MLRTLASESGRYLSACPEHEYLHNGTGDKSASALLIWRELLNTLCLLCPTVLKAAKKQLTAAAPAWLDADHLQTIQQPNYGDEDGQVVLEIFLGELWLYLLYTIGPLGRADLPLLALVH